MDIEFLKTFIEVNNTRHFGKASDNLFITQSTVSARIRQLEDEVGASLFVRNRNDIQLTPAGQRLLKYAENIINTWSRARQEIAIEEEDGIPLTIAGLPSLWDISLQDWLHFTAKKFPDMMLHAEVLVPEVMTKRLIEGTLDIGFMFEAPQVSALQILDITTIPLLLVSSSKGLTAAQALESSYVFVDWGTSFSISHARHFPDMPAPSMRMGLGRMALEYLLVRGGAAYLAEPMVQEYIDAGKLFYVQDAPVIERNATAVFSHQSEKHGLISKVLEYFK